MENKKTKSELKVLNNCLTRKMNQTEQFIKNIELKLQFIQNVIDQSNSDSNVIERFRVETESD